MMEFLETYHLVGIVVGAATFLIIGVFHPFVIKGEYYFGVRCWWAFAVSGVAALAASLWVENLILSILLAVWGASSLWGIGVFHPFVIKGEYYFGVRCWWAFAVSGVAALAASLWVENLILSILLAVWGASSLWGIGELFEQRERVAKGWFPKREKKNRRGGR